MPSHPPFAEPPPTSIPDGPPVRPDALGLLLHRWFVQYNPLPLASAALVLAGMWLLSRAAAEASSLAGQLGVAAIAEVYALALIGGAAVLRRAGLSRAAAMLALLAVLYQADLTMHLETCAYLGALGVAAALMWWGLFVVKLHLLGWALQLRLSSGARWVPSVGAGALAAFPLVLRHLDTVSGGALATLLVFAVGVLGTFAPLRVESAEPMDVRGVRAVRATWAAWSLLFVLHVTYGVVEHGLTAALLPALALLATRWLADPRRVLAALVAVLLAVAWLAPEALSLTAFMVGVMAALHALWPARSMQQRETLPDPYRSLGRLSVAMQVVDSAGSWHRAGFMSLACLAFYVSARTAGVGDLSAAPERWLLDVPLLLACAALAWRLRRVLPLLAVAPAMGWRLAHADWITAPRGPLEYGLWLTGTGFALLLVSVLGSRAVSRRAAQWRARQGPTSTAVPSTRSPTQLASVVPL